MPAPCDQPRVGGSLGWVGLVFSVGPVATVLIAIGPCQQVLTKLGGPGEHSALWRVVIVRLSCDQRTRDYLDKRVSEGKS